jgi:hypothetical protein
MLKRYMLSLLSLSLGGLFMSLTPGSTATSNHNNDSYDYPINVKPAISDEYNHPQQPKYEATGREEIAYIDERDMDIHDRANRKGDWNYKQNWRYDREAFYRGETQGEAYDREHPDGVGGPGMDRDTEYLQMRHYYLEDAKKNHQHADVNQKSNAYFYENHPNVAYRSGNRVNQPISYQQEEYSQPIYPH